MDSKSTLTMLDTPGKNCPLNILTPFKKVDSSWLTWGGRGYLTSRFFWYKCVTIRAG